MKICGLQKTTLLDFPGKVAATVFLGGCNLRCPFCHNSDLLDGRAPEFMTMDELTAFLRKRSGVLEGVCVTGGEPTLWPDDVAELMDRIQSLGLKVKLDTNGFRPKVLKELCGAGLADYVAMDIKAGRHHYAEVCGIDGAADSEADGTPGGFNLAAVEESAAWLMEGHVPFEFRTTVVKGLHTEADFTDIAAWIGGCGKYFLQGFVDSGRVLKSGFAAFSRAELEEFLKIVKPVIPEAEIRGVDY